jgi:hypothetical protein
VRFVLYLTTNKTVLFNSMESQSKQWPLSKLIKMQDKIDPRPQYQRTPVWSLEKKKLLIDSILTGYDLPKIYLRKLDNNPHFEYEIADGQQRLNAIWEFVSKDANISFSLESLTIDNVSLDNVSYSRLPLQAKKRFDSYLVAISVITDASPTQIRTLFARLQMGVGLNSAELRHAIASNVGVAIDGLVQTVTFFNRKCGIADKRYKHQDYIDRIMALMHYQNKKDLKAPLLKQLYIDLASASSSDVAPYIAFVYKILKWMESINNYHSGIFKNQWGFVDVFNLLYTYKDTITGVKPKEFAEQFMIFEKKRLKFNSKPKELIEDKSSVDYDPHLFYYIEAFTKQAGVKGNVARRLETMHNKFYNSNVLTIK